MGWDGLGVCAVKPMCSFSGLVLHRRPPSSVAAETDPAADWMTGGQAGSEH